jgi:hypothetical protein
LIKQSFAVTVLLASCEAKHGDRTADSPIHRSRRSRRHSLENPH